MPSRKVQATPATSAPEEGEHHRHGEQRDPPVTTLMAAVKNIPEAAFEASPNFSIPEKSPAMVLPRYPEVVSRWFAVPERKTNSGIRGFKNALNRLVQYRIVLHIGLIDGQSFH
jgi:hypothetical protein